MSGAMEYTRQMQAPNLDSIVTVTTIFSLHKVALHIYIICKLFGGCGAL